VSNATVTIWTLIEWIYSHPDSNDRYPHVHQTYVTDVAALAAEKALQARKGPKCSTEVLTSYMSIADAFDLVNAAQSKHEKIHATFTPALERPQHEHFHCNS